MRDIDREVFYRNSREALAGILDQLEKAPALELDSLEGERTALVILDMINGFAREGSLQSPRVEALIPGIVDLMAAARAKGIVQVAMADNHPETAQEFGSYPPHCIEGTSEAEIVDEIKEEGGYVLLPKNSTNGFLEEAFQQWLKDHPAIDTFILAGDCTDICVQQMALTLKAHFNRQNKASRIIVPDRVVDTYDLGIHQAELMHVMALYNMMINGVEIVESVI